MKICLVSTYPEHKSRNVGDRLITVTTERLIRDVCGVDVGFTRVFCGSGWDDIKATVLAADFVLFACLSARRRMEAIYPAGLEIIRSGVPFGAIASGTSANMNATTISAATEFTDSSLAFLREFDRKAQFFTSRGVISQYLLRDAGCENVRFGGDVCFYDPRFDARVFRPVERVRRIAVSDPHHSIRYRKSFATLCHGLRRLFPKAEIDLLMHSKNWVIEQLAADLSLPVRKLFVSPEGALDLYDDYDLHVGYRVHGHVSALKRRKPSYLLEQDGRGADYSLTLDRNISAPHYMKLKDRKPRYRFMANFLRNEPIEAIQKMLLILAADQSNGFAKFANLEEQLLGFSRANQRTIRDWWQAQSAAAGGGAAARAESTPR